jgi:hypothetical protein
VRSRENLNTSKSAKDAQRFCFAGSGLRAQIERLSREADKLTRKPLRNGVEKSWPLLNINTFASAWALGKRMRSQ